ncbi:MULTISPECIES: hypothetical protein [Burkholderiaceae]|uniref:hypothetical protein n=1 Tax=Burkholderiaceae TaxID=119060 RepID=UPI00141FC502|nr:MULTISPECIES: hypothetical protein [Burkholderiaceae]MBN3849565.1 hypothetical protein [Paraburkholderia sp. Ac-20342]NIF51108.1 hypothetical protein [Burkholderia sp. Ax-1724]
MWVIWALIAGTALASFYALLPDAHLGAPSPDMPTVLAGDIATHRSELEDYVVESKPPAGVVPQGVFVHAGNWNYTSLRWQNYVNNGIVVVYPSTGIARYRQDFSAQCSGRLTTRSKLAPHKTDRSSIL